MEVAGGNWDTPPSGAYFHKLPSSLELYQVTNEMAGRRSPMVVDNEMHRSAPS